MFILFVLCPVFRFCVFLFFVSYICVLVPALQLTFVLLNGAVNYYRFWYYYHYHYFQSITQNMYVTTKFSTSDITNREANISSLGKGSSWILWKIKDHYSVQKNPTHVSILSHTNPVFYLPFYFINMCFNTILPSTPRSSKCSPISKFIQKNSA